MVHRENDLKSEVISISITLVRVFYAFLIFKVSRFVRVHTVSHHNGHNEMIFAVFYV